jgi:MFS family permease
MVADMPHGEQRGGRGGHMDEHKQPTSRASCVLLLILLAIYIYSFLDRQVISMVIDPIRKTLHIDNVKMSYLMGLSFALFYAAGGVPMGWLVDRLPRRWVLYFGVTAWGLAQAACGFAGTFNQLFVSRIFVGVGESCMMPAAHSLLSDAFPRARLATAISIYSMGAVIGVGLSSILGGAVVQALLSYKSINLPLLGPTPPWQVVFLGTGLPGLMIAFLIFAAKEPARRGPAYVKAEGPRRSMWPFLLKNRRLWLTFTLVFGVMNVAYGALLFWQPAYFSRYFHWRPADYGLALGLISAIAGGGGLLFSGAVVDRLFAKGMKDAHLVYFMWALILTTPIVIYALLSSNVWVYLGLIWIAQFATVNFLGFGSAAVQLTTPIALRGRMSALFSTAIVALMGTSLGSSAPAWIAKYWLHDEVRLGYAIAVTFAICVPIALLGVLFGRRPFREAIDEAQGWSHTT